MAHNVCDFCLSEGTGIFSRPQKLPDGHYICKNCKAVIQKYGLPVKYDLFQTLVTSQANMTDMMMDAWLEHNAPDDAIAKYYPLPKILLHEGEHCLNAVKAAYTVKKENVPQEFAVKNISEVRKGTINNIPDAGERSGSEKIEGILYETEAALYFLSEKIVNVHRLGYVKRNTRDKEHVTVQTPSKKFTYQVKNADLFFLRERFYQKVMAAKNNKRQHLIYISDDNQLTITPGVYDIPRSLRPGIYKVKAINDAGLHMKDPLGHVTDYYESEESISLTEGGVLECTGEYKLEFIRDPEEDDDK